MMPTEKELKIINGDNDNWQVCQSIKRRQQLDTEVAEG